ncbi:hypothetical protein Back11_22940 [Paenibacillus baekrokdamisoli]|uniref:Cell wall elongation regulator TseB-like domain-containing protein n=1 Tax=Paenibacillus baekrokdamisoli TaxID=1712516 RepID=A0A3G9JDA3_9BACL|nr:DUF5590 domain-containing protein [Paenibacillus baekrokdamisoli]BBH20949.1 hypothetical protein Back11_22940 [Paenibacillus baekrokdamisoli]
MTAARWTLLSVMIVVVVLIALNAYYRSVQSPMWKQERLAEAKAIETAGLKEATLSYPFVWDESIWIVEGKDKNNEDTYVWLKKDTSLVLKAKDGLTSQEIEQRFLQSKPDASIKNTKLGMLNNAPVWEVYYSKVQSSVKTYYYDFYQFQNGAFVVTYKLPTQ